MGEHEHKSGGNSVAIVVAVCLVLFLLVPCVLVVFGGFGFLMFKSRAPANPAFIEEAMPVPMITDEKKIDGEPEGLSVPPAEAPASDPADQDPRTTPPESPPLG